MGLAVGVDVGFGGRAVQVVDLGGFGFVGPLEQRVGVHLGRGAVERVRTHLLGIDVGRRGPLESPEAESPRRRLLGGLGRAVLETRAVLGDRIGVVVVGVVLGVVVEDGLRGAFTGGRFDVGIGDGLRLGIGFRLGMGFLLGLRFRLDLGFRLGVGCGLELGFGGVDLAVGRRRGLSVRSGCGVGLGGRRLVDRRRGRFRLVRPDDWDLAGQFGDGDGVGVTPPTAAPAADRRRADRAVLGQQLGHRDRPGAAVVIWSSHRLFAFEPRCLPSSIAYRHLP